VDSSKIHADLGWSPSHDFDRGLQATILWHARKLEKSIQFSKERTTEI
jgi:dTDP-D-glucose 4,6-dehydratase